MAPGVTILGKRLFYLLEETLSIRTPTYLHSPHCRNGPYLLRASALCSAPKSPLLPSKMSDNPDEVCANCGKEGSDTIKLKNCTACYLVKYCSVDCQKIHRKQHKKACKKRAAELNDEKLYSQGHERAAGDYCPICLLAIPFPVEDHAMLRPCCMKMVCFGCCQAAFQRGLREDCPFCRTPPAENDEETLEMVKKRVDARDPEAIYYLGDLHFRGIYGLKKDLSRALELWTEAADLGSTAALFKMGGCHMEGEGLAKDEAKAVEYWKVAAMQGEVQSRHNLGFYELEKGDFDRGVRHFLISAKMGYKGSLGIIKDMFANGHATKAQYAEALKGYQAAMEETKSPDRELEKGNLLEQWRRIVEGRGPLT